MNTRLPTNPNSNYNNSTKNSTINRQCSSDKKLKNFRSNFALKNKEIEKEKHISIKDTLTPRYNRGEQKSNTVKTKSTENDNLLSLPYRKNDNNFSDQKIPNETSTNFTFQKMKKINIFKQNFKSCSKALPVVKTRKDFFGIMIRKGSKNHNIIFKDKLNEDFKLMEIIDVESYKQYNLQDYEYEENNEDKDNEDNDKDNKDKEKENKDNENNESENTKENTNENLKLEK